MEFFFLIVGHAKTCFELDGWCDHQGNKQNIELLPGKTELANRRQARTPRQESNDVAFSHKEGCRGIDAPSKCTCFCLTWVVRCFVSVRLALKTRMVISEFDYVCCTRLNGGEMWCLALMYKGMARAQVLGRQVCKHVSVGRISEMELWWNVS